MKSVGLPFGARKKITTAISNQSSSPSQGSGDKSDRRTGLEEGGRYIIMKDPKTLSPVILGRGGFGEVHLMRDSVTGKDVAVKLALQHGVKEANDVLQEALKLLQIQHENIVTCVEVFLTSKPQLGVCIVLEFCAYGDLDRFLGQLKPGGIDLTPKGQITIMGQLVRALRYLHEEKRLLHRDIKTANILVSSFSSPNEISVKLSDFGLAKGLSQSSIVRTMAGTPAFVAPEVATGEDYGRGADIFSLGVVFLIVLTKNPSIFQSLDSPHIPWSLVFKNETSYIISIKKLLVGSRWTDMVLKMMSKTPENRYSLDSILAVLGV
jgi:serine/threonine protein kinase